MGLLLDATVRFLDLAVVDTFARAVCTTFGRAVAMVVQLSQLLLDALEQL